jgi:hypothetical protein
VISPSTLGENPGSLFDKCSARNRATTLWRPPPEFGNRSPGVVSTATEVDIQDVHEKATESYRKPNVTVQFAAALSTERSVPSNGGRRNRHLTVGTLFKIALTSEQVHDAIGGLRRDADPERPDPHQNMVEAEATTPVSDTVTPPVTIGPSAEPGVVP